MRIRIKLILCIIGTVILSQLMTQLQAAEIPAFETVVLDDNIGKVCYAVTVADVNNDGKPDPVALSENRLIWFENPSWKPHVILEDQLELDHVCLAPQDIDGDGLVDFAVGAGWTKVGTIQWISRDKANPDGLWKVYPIAVEQWTHRMRWSDVLGKGKPQLTVSPLNKTQGEGVRFQAFEIPKDPRKDRWQPTVLDDSFNRMHNHWHVAGDESTDLLEQTITASQEGIHLLRNKRGEIIVEKIAAGAEGEAANSRGAGEVKTDSLFAGVSLIATVEPMHGNQAVVYLPDVQKGDGYVRIVLDDTLGRGHALWLADITKNGLTDVIIGHSEPASGNIKGPGIYIFTADSPNAAKWTKHVLDDGGIATEDLIAHDFNGDGWIDILAGGRNTHNVKLYLNQGPAKKDSN